MRALTWQGRRKVAVADVPEPKIIEPQDAIVRVTSAAICGSDLHLYEVLGPFLDAGDVLGHEAMGIVEEVGSDVDRIQPGDRVVIPFVIACGHCWMCQHCLQSQCQTTQNLEAGTGAALFGYTKLYGQIPGGQAQFIRVPFAEVGLVQVPDDGEPDERYLYLSDVLPTAWQAVEYAGYLPGEALAVIGLGPIGQMATRVALQRGVETVIGLDLVPERIATARRFGVTALDVSQIDDVGAAMRDLTGGRGPDAVVDAVGMEAHGSPGAKALQTAAGVLPDAMGTSVFTSAGVDRLAALLLAIEMVRRGGTVSISGVYGGAIDPMPMLSLFDKQVTMRMGQANVHSWIPDLLPLVTDPGDPLNVLDLATHRLSLEDAPHGYDIFQHKTDGALKIVLDPWLSATDNEVEEP